MSIAAGESRLFCHTPASSAKCCLLPPFPSCSLRIAPSRRNKPTAAMAYMQRDGNPCTRRAVLVMGFAGIRHLKMSAHATDDALPAESTESAAPDLNQKAEMKNIVKEKEATIASMEKKYKEELKNEKEFRNNALRRVKEEQQSLANQLEIATGTIRNLAKELLEERKLVNELTDYVDDLKHCAQNAGDEKRQLHQQLEEKLDCVDVLQEKIDMLSFEINDKQDSIRRLSCKLSDNDRELDQLSSLYHQWSLESENMPLKDVVLKDESNKQFDAISMEYNSFKSSVAEKWTSDAMPLKEREEKIHLLEEQLKISLGDSKKDRVLISALTQERVSLRETLNVELIKLRYQKEELMTTQATLDCQLMSATRSCWELEHEVEKLADECGKARESSQWKLDEAKQGGEEVMNLEAQFLKEKEARKSLEAKLEEATKHLNELNQNAELNRELELAQSQISTLEEEKKQLYNFIAEQGHTSRKYQACMEDAHNMVTRLVKEREILIKRGKRLEEDLCYAKGKILRLLCGIRSSKSAVNVQQIEKVEVGVETAGVIPSNKIDS